MSETTIEPINNNILARDYVTLCIGYLSIFIMIPLTIHFFLQLKKNANSFIHSKDNQMNTSTPIRNASIIAIILYLLFIIFQAIYLTFWILILAEHGNKTMNLIIDISSMSTYVLNQFCLFLFILLQRINYAFPMGKYFNIFSYIVPPLLFIIVCFCGIMSTVTSNYRTWSRFAAFGALITYMIYGILCILFIRKISKVMKYRMLANIKLKEIEMKDKTNERLITNSKTTPSVQSNSNDIVISLNTIHDSVRYSILVLFSVITMFAPMIASLIGNTVTEHESHRHTISYAIIPFDALCNTVCIMFLFHFYESKYHFVCGKCHKCMLNCCVNKVSKVAIKQNSNANTTKEQYASLIL